MRDAWFRAGVGAQTLAVAHCWLLYPGTGKRACGPLTNINININISNAGGRSVALSSPDRIRSLSQGSDGGQLCSALGTAMSEGQAVDEVDSSGRPRVLGLGSAGVDFIAAVDRYPTADEKVRTQSLQVLGGGNCGNTLSAASRLGLDACLVTKVGSDANGRLILQGLEEEGVDVSRVIVSDATPSAFTYVIVDKEGGTRTCLHTPQTEDILPEEITPDLLDGVAAVHLDSRHTPAAVALAKLANERGVPVVLDAEKDRPFLKDLLPLADYVICNRNFPQAFTGRYGADGHENAIRELLEQGRAQLVVTTLGAEGCIVVTREKDQPWRGYGEFSVRQGCPMHIRTAVRPEVGMDDLSTTASSEKKATPMAYAPARYVWASAWPIEASDIVDTTGAGDCFIAGFIYGMTHRLGIARTLAVASYVAAKKLSLPGARQGVPTFSQLQADSPGLLSPDWKS
ncbi:unnamed protein product [Ectocarpus sp. 12 AP-2014]